MTTTRAVTVLYGSQTGCAESIAQRIYDEALEREIDASLHPLNDFQSLQLTEPATHTGKHHVIVVCSTTGNGDPPDNASKFWRFIKRRTQPKDLLSPVLYTMLGLGDTNYDKFCYMGKSVDKRMHELGAERFFDMLAADEAMGLEDQVEPWLDGLWGAFDASCGGAETSSSSDDDTTGNAPTAGDEDGQVETTKTPRYLPENLITYESMFGPFPPDSSTETPEDVPRLQSSLYTVRFMDANAEQPNVAQSVMRDGDTVDHEYSASDPFGARLRSARLLTAPESERKVLYLDLDIKESKIQYTPGDSIGVKCPNRESDVAALLQVLEMDGDALICVEPVAAGKKRKPTGAKGAPRYPSPCSVHDAFQFHTDILSSPKKAVLRALATYCTDDEERARMLVLSSKSGADKYQRFVTDQQLNFVELLHIFPSCRPPLDHLLSLLPQLMPRFYSIATSPLVDATKLGIAFTVVDEPMGPHAIQRRGLCTNWLASLAESFLVSPPASSISPSSPSKITVPIFLRPTRDFRLPASHEFPLLFIGPGTGVAPFMGFLQHRFTQVSQRVAVASEVCSGCWRGGMEVDDLKEDDEYARPPSLAAESKGIHLFFGCRRAEEDWIFEHEMKEYLANGTLDHLFTAFSRENPGEKRYVQHELRQHGKLVCDLLLDAGGYVYVCGDGTNMAKDVHAALCDVLQEHAQLSRPEAEEKLAALAARQRYVRDIW